MAGDNGNSTSIGACSRSGCGVRTVIVVGAGDDGNSGSVVAVSRSGSG